MRKDETINPQVIVKINLVNSIQNVVSGVKKKSHSNLSFCIKFVK